MTIIRPNKQKKILPVFLLIFTIPLALGALSLVVLYNQTVNLEHRADEIRKNLDTLQAKSADLREKLLVLFENDAVDAFAAEHGLVKEKNPEYLKVNTPWEVASR